MERLSEAGKKTGLFFTVHGVVILQLVAVQAFLTGLVTLAYLDSATVASVLLPSSCVAGLLGQLLSLPLLLARHVVLFLRWILACDASAAVVVAAAPSGKGRLVEALLVMLPSGLLTALVSLYLSRGSGGPRAGDTILRINSAGDWEFGPSAKREAASSCQPPHRDIVLWGEGL